MMRDELQASSVFFQLNVIILKDRDDVIIAIQIEIEDAVGLKTQQDAIIHEIEESL